MGKQGCPPHRRGVCLSRAQQSSPGSVSASPPAALGCWSCLGAGVRAVLRGEGAQGMAQRGTDPRAPFHPRDGLSSCPGRGTNPHGTTASTTLWALGCPAPACDSCSHPEMQALMSLSRQ